MDDLEEESEERLVGKTEKGSTLIRVVDGKADKSEREFSEEDRERDCEPEPSSPSWFNVWPQVAASCIALSITFQSGIGLSFSSVLIPQLTTEFPDFTKAQASWIASVTTMTIPVGALIVGPVMDLIGRKVTCVVACIPIIASWITTYFASSVGLWPVYLARALIGLGSGLTTAAVVYTAEVSCVHFRAALLCLNSVSVALGILVTTTIGGWLHWKTTSAWFGLLSVFNLFLLLFVPESPYWLAHFRRSEERTVKARTALKWLNRPQWLFRNEWKHLEDSLGAGDEEERGLCSKLKQSLVLLCSRSCRYPLLLLALLFLLQQFSGVYVVIFYAVNIFQSVGGHFGPGIDEYTATAFIGIVRFLMSIVTTMVSRRWGRRPLMMCSGAGMAISCLAVGVIHLASGEATLQFIGSDSTTAAQNVDGGILAARISVLVGIVIFVCFAALGHMALPWVMVSEFLPTSARGLGNGFMVCYAYLLMSAVVKSTPYLLDAFGLAAVFLGFGFVAAVSVAYVYYYIPETLGKPFAEIENFFLNK